MGQGIPNYKGFLAVGKHATSLSDMRQAAVARTAFAAYHSIEPQHKQGQEFEGSSRGADPSDASLGNYDARVRGQIEGTTEGPMPLLARSLLGGQPTTTTVGTTGKQHELLLADSIPLDGGRLSAEIRKGVNAQAETQNIVCSKLEFQLNQEGYARWAMEALGSTPTRTSSPTTASLPAVGTLLSKRPSVFTFNGSATAKIVRNLSWTLSRKLDDKDYDIGSRQRRDTAYGEMTAEFDAEITYQDETPREEFWGGAGNAAPTDASAFYPVNIKTEGATIAGGTAKHTVMLDLPRCFITEVADVMQGDDVIRSRVKGRAVLNPGGYAQKLTFINTLAGF